MVLIVFREEIFKYGGSKVNHRLHFISDVWNAQCMPQQWKDANIVMVYKWKVDNADCENYRGILPFAVAGKNLSSILFQRLLIKGVYLLLPETQCGFCKACSTTWFFAFTSGKMQGTAQISVNLAEAFNAVNRDMLWHILVKCGCPPNFIAKISH